MCTRARPSKGLGGAALVDGVLQTYGYILS
jgi:hypothetical protein